MQRSERVAIVNEVLESIALYALPFDVQTVRLEEGADGELHYVDELVGGFVSVTGSQAFVGSTLPEAFGTGFVDKLAEFVTWDSLDPDPYLQLTAEMLVPLLPERDGRFEFLKEVDKLCDQKPCTWGYLS